MKKRIISAFAFLLTFAMLTGCSENGGSAANSGRSSDSSVSSTDPQSGSEPESSSTESGSQSPVEVSSTVENVDIPPVEITADNMLTSVKLFDVISEGKENSMFSPLSLNMALGLLAEGAEGDSRTALDTYLGTDNYSDFANSYMQIVESRYNYVSEYDDGWKNVFEIANSFWANKDLPFKEDYRNTLAEKFKAEVRNLDFADKDKALGEINGWVSEKTHKMIPKILNDYSDDIAAVLVNTIYFESAWREEWSIYENMTQPFTLPDGSTREMALMHNVVGDYYENDAATAFGCGYLNGLEFIGILPKETGDFTIESLDIPSLLDSVSYQYDVSASMPKLNFETDIPLTDTLKAFGLSDIFDRDKADLSGISDVPMFVSKVLQKTKLELDENGTKAAAATVIIATNTAMPEEREKKEVTLDRPFAFMIYDSAEHQIVFLGKVTNP